MVAGKRFHMTFTKKQLTALIGAIVTIVTIVISALQ